MKKNKIGRYLVIMVCAIVVSNVLVIGIIYTSRWSTKKHLNELQFNKKIYVYDTIGGWVNPALYVKDYSSIPELKKYYMEAEKGIDAYLPTRITYLPLNRQVYIKASYKDMYHVVDFDTSCWGHVEGYIYAKTAHLESPPDSILEAYRTKIHNQSQKEKTLNKKYGKLSPYGIQCW